MQIYVIGKNLMGNVVMWKRKSFDFALKAFSGQRWMLFFYLNLLKKCELFKVYNFSTIFLYVDDILKKHNSFLKFIQCELQRRVYKGHGVNWCAKLGNMKNHRIIKQMTQSDIHDKKPKKNAFVFVV
jgi:hypothetical protein